MIFSKKRKRGRTNFGKKYKLTFEVNLTKEYPYLINQMKMYPEAKLGKSPSIIKVTLILPAYISPKDSTYATENECNVLDLIEK